MAWWQYYLPRKWLFFEKAAKNLCCQSCTHVEMILLAWGMAWSLCGCCIGAFGSRPAKEDTVDGQSSYQTTSFVTLQVLNFVFQLSWPHSREQEMINNRNRSVVRDMKWSLHLSSFTPEGRQFYRHLICISQVSTCTWEMIRFFWCFCWPGFSPRNCWGADCQKLFGCTSRAVFKGFRSESSRSIHFQWKHQWFLNTSRPLNLRICIIYEDGAVIVGTVDGQRLGKRESFSGFLESESLISVAKC